MANDAPRIAGAAIRDVAEKEPEPVQDCADIVHIALFFDGTGNNREADDADQKWSNVARIFRSATLKPDRDTAHFSIYISGVGTKFNKQAASWLEGASTWLEDNVLGAGAGAGGDRRMAHGEERINDRLRTVLLANAKRLGGEVAAYAERGKNKSFQELHEALSKYRLIKVINLSVFGFSRGAALARAFTNRIVRECEAGSGTLTYRGVPLRISFMGLFDTVASFGVPAKNVQLPFAERDLIVPEEAERCVHYVAAHELRYSFPVDLIRKNGKLNGDWSELVYPGVHSDVGGGYPPLDQDIDNNYARKPMRDMMREALLSGVRITPYEQIKTEFEARFTEMFECRAETEEALRHYLAVVGTNAGTVEEQVKRHLEVYYSAYGTMHRKGIEGPGDRQRAASSFKRIVGPRSLAGRMQLYRNAAEASKMIRIGGGNLQAFAQYVKPQQWQVDAWDTDASDQVVKFVANYVHDSKVDFLGNIEPFHYFSLREIQESSVSVWRQVADWAGEQADSVKRGAIRAGSYAQTKANEAKEAATDTARRARDSLVEMAEEAEQAARRTVDSARQKADEWEQGAERVIEQGVNWIKQAVDQTRRAAERVREKVGDIF